MELHWYQNKVLLDIETTGDITKLNPFSLENRKMMFIGDLHIPSTSLKSIANNFIGYSEKENLRLLMGEFPKSNDDRYGLRGLEKINKEIILHYELFQGMEWDELSTEFVIHHASKTDHIHSNLDLYKNPKLLGYFLVKNYNPNTEEWIGIGVGKVKDIVNHINSRSVLRYCLKYMTSYTAKTNSGRLRQEPPSNMFYCVRDRLRFLEENNSVDYILGDT